MNFKALLDNKPLLFGIIGGVILVIALVVMLSFTGNKKVEETDKPITEDIELLSTDSIGQAIEIQSLLAKEGITATRTAEGSKSKIILRKEDKITMAKRDRALIAVVKSGLMDKHIGLEIFDKGDFTSSKEDKRIRLARAVNGELSRLIRKIPPIEDASVFVALPEQTIFTSMQKPVTATVQITIPSGEKLERDKVRAITNLLMGSVQGLDAKNISITDTNGNVYSSVMTAEEDMLTLLEENDKYMKNKVMVQLDRLLGKGNYVVTVSTYLREAPLETTKLTYNPKESSVASEQRFTEGLGDKSQDTNKVTSAVSSFIPGGLPQAPNSSSNRRYTRAATELQYGLGKTQTSELKSPGMIEEITVAVTLDQGAMPSGMTVEEMKELIARTANPKVIPDNVEIAFADLSSPLLASERPVQLAKPADSGNPWWTAAVILGIMLIAGLIFISGKAKEAAKKHQYEIDSLMEKTELQQRQINEANDRAVKLQSLQEQMHKSITTTSQVQPQQQNLVNLQQTINDIDENIQEDNIEEIGIHLKSWIESSG